MITHILIDFGIVVGAAVGFWVIAILISEGGKKVRQKIRDES